MRWIWQQPGWPDFRYDKRALEDRELEFRTNSERLAGRFAALPMASQEDATIDLMLSEAIKTSAIEDEDLDRESVRSSLRSLITSDTLPENSDQKAAGAVSLRVDVRKNWQISMTHDLLAKRGISVTYESIRRWCNKFRQQYARRSKRRHQGFGDTFFIDEVFVKIDGTQNYL